MSEYWFGLMEAEELQYIVPFHQFMLLEITINIFPVDEQNSE